ncbi:MAG TPA: TonB-dependent receptor, partial [Candidatus Polarisedimenticolia bacterium]|nr:TonB-dependent receptor [Candidatus Polarisedimenticolia bacterium]
GWSATAPPPPVAPPGEEMILFQDIPSVFAASKYEQKPTEAPASVSIITAEEIERYGYRTLSEVLGSVRGFLTTYDRNYTYANVRGFGRPGDYNTRLLLLLDGHRVNENVYDGAYLGTDSLIDVDWIDRVEVIRGPSSSLYGTNAFFAVVNVVSKSGRHLKGAEGEVAGGSFGTGQARVTYGNGFENGLDLIASAATYDSHGQPLFYPEFDSPATKDGRTSGTDGDRYTSGFVKAAAGNVTIEGAFKSRDKGIPTASYGTDFGDRRNATIDRRAFLRVRYERELDRASRFDASVAYDAYRYDGTYIYSGVVEKDYGYGRWWSVDTQYARSFLEHHKLIAGTEYRNNLQQDQGVYDVNPAFTYLSDARSSSLWAVFAQDEVRLGTKVLINAGLRHDGYSTFGGTTNPRLGVILDAGADTTIKVLYGRAFRAPNAYELYYADGLTQKANPDLTSESIATYEVAMEHAFGREARSVVSLYHYSIRDLINLETDPADMLLVFRNLDRVRADGAEAEIEGRLGERLEGRLSYAYQNAEDRATGEWLTNSPRHLAKLNLTIPFRNERLQPSLEVHYVGPRRTVSGDRAGGFTTANLVLLCRRWIDGLALTAGIYNLLDRSYADPASEEHVQSVIPQDGRSYRLQLKYRF